MKISFSEAPHTPVELPPLAELAEFLTIENSPVLFGCRTGICGTCLCEVEASPDDKSDAKVSAPSEDEQELLNIIAPENPRARLACQIRAEGDIRIRYLGQE